MRVIGLTGGIASGKSTVSAWLRQWGAHIVDADAISRETTKQGGRGYRAVVAHFGREILRPDGELDRRKLGGIVFADEGNRRELEGVLHPIVIEESRAEMARAAAQGCAVCVLDVPLLFESGMETLCDETWVVVVPPQEQLRRVMARDGLTAQQAQARIDSQMPLSEKLARADRAIDNSGSREATKARLRALWEELA